MAVSAQTIVAGSPPRFRRVKLKSEPTTSSMGAARDAPSTTTRTMLETLTQSGKRTDGAHRYSRGYTDGVSRKTI
jgi:hypothetical protein